VSPTASDPRRRWAVVLAALTLASVLVFGLRPDLDIAVSRAFYVAGTGFRLAAEPTAVAERWIIWRLSEAMFLLSLAALLFAAFGRRIAGIEPRRWGFVALLYLAGPLFLVNGILKRYSGRARPADIVEFGGQLQFTAPFQIADQCLRNCSFVSGEGAAAVALAVTVAVLISAPALGLAPATRRAYVLSAATVAFMGSFLRLATGRHFLSDTIFAALFVGIIALFLHYLMLSPRGDAAPQPPGGGR
jgi:lipid A 4'-phosphatase